jgi:hypothetical protein
MKDAICGGKKAMKRVYALVLLMMVSAPLYAQVNFSVSTDKSAYGYGDSIHITITAVNIGTLADTMVFGSTCQVNYYVDRFDLLGRRTCGQIVTYCAIPAHDSVKWSAPYLTPYPVTRDTLLAGKHAVVGEVIRYWISDTTWITVNPAVGVAGYGNGPYDYVLCDNYPNPFNPSTTLQYGLPERSRVRLQVYDILGQVVADLVNSEQAAGWNQVIWKAIAPSGLYFYRLEAVSVSDPGKRFVDVKKMILLK